MPTLELTPLDLKSYRKGDRKHIFYDRSCEEAKTIAVHANGLFPDGLLRNRRPHEPIEVFEYRKTIFEAITKPAFTKVFSSLQKIRRSADWNIDFGDKEDDFAKIPDGEKLSDYTTTDFPFFTSVTNWVFNFMLRKYMIDPNAVVLIMPLNLNVDINVYKEPFPIIFDSEFVIDYKEEDFCLLKNPAGSYYYNSQRNLVLGESYYFVTSERIQRWDQADGKFNFDLMLDYVHDLGFMPAMKLGGVLIDQANGEYLYESRIAGMAPELNEALREYSDLQAARVLHIYPERWEYSNVECPTCQGKARVPNLGWYDGCKNCGDEWEQCGACHGTGIFTNKGPYEKHLVRAPNNAVGDTGNVPTPPAGFIEKDVTIVKFQDESVEAHIYKAYSAINFEFLANTPLNQSGTAKEVDKDELNNTVNSFAEDIVNVMDFVYRAIANYRYGFQYGDTVNDMLPDIAVPVNYDLLGNSNAQAAFATAKTAGANPVILNALETEYASKYFYSNPEVKEMLLLELNLDPLPNIAESDKILMLTNKGIDQLTYVVSSNIHPFVQRAIEEDPDFCKLKPAQQKVIIEAYAQELIDAATAKAQLARAQFNASGNGVYNSQSQVDENGNLITPTGGADPNANGGELDLLNQQQTKLNNGIPPGYTGSAQ